MSWFEGSHPGSVIRFVLGCLAALAALGALAWVVFAMPRDSQSGSPVEGPRDGMTSYCLPDSTLRVFERPFPQGGTQPLFSVVDTRQLAVDDPYLCGRRAG